MVLNFLWQAPESDFPTVKLKLFSYRLLVIQSWAKFTQINFSFKIQFYILCFILKNFDYTDVNFFTSAFKTKSDKQSVVKQ